MQTFLPYPNFKDSLMCLDVKRLTKQRLEALQILRLLTDDTFNSRLWINHPVVKMWKGYENYLSGYYNTSLEVFTERGYKNNLLKCTFDKDFQYNLNIKWFPDNKPWFIGNRSFHQSHQSNLLRKDYNYYSKFGWGVPTDIPYMWKQL